ncbi:uncharacterized protein LOC110294857 [Mus caroli]|uniref:Uncharacterized protein LOC110294857 n=1 Tax=Mus caroli TaxID=10089 RepID=A0A6P5PSH0_MUSCR|nr:uncharacterized protein LOC110294857 [Mus caroli]
MLLQSQSPPSFSPGALEAGLQVCWAAAGGAGGGREPRVRAGGGGAGARPRRYLAPSNAAARGVRRGLRWEPSAGGPGPHSSEALSQARRSPRCTPNPFSASCFLRGKKKKGEKEREASRCGAKRGAGRQGEGAGTYSAKRGAERSGQETQARLPGARNPAGRQVKRFGPDGVRDRDRDRTDARVGSARVALALRSGRGSARLGSRLPSGSLAPTLGSHMTPAPLALRASPGLAGGRFQPGGTFLGKVETPGGVRLPKALERKGVRGSALLPEKFSKLRADPPTWGESSGWPGAQPRDLSFHTLRASRHFFRGNQARARTTSLSLLLG